MSASPGGRSGGTRREARERAVELLYEAEAKSVHPAEVVAALPLVPDAYALELAYGVADHQIEIDRILDRFAKRWPVSRMAAMDRTVLRLGTLELATSLDVPRGVCLSEAVELGARYGSTDDTSKFVNGVLARVADEVRDGSRPWTSIRVVVFDMDGVIRHWTGERIAAFEQEHGLPSGRVAEIAFSEPLFSEAMHGTKTAQEWAAQIGRRLAADHPGLDIDACTSMWLAVDWEIDDDVVALIRSIRSSGQRTALFSNASTALEDDLETIGIADLFDVVANSSRLGSVKPEIAAFETVAELIGEEPVHLLFVDDRAENVAGAVDAGWHAVQMRGVDRFAAVLRRLGVPGAPDPS